MTAPHRLVYVSRNGVPGTPDDTAPVIRSILAASRRNNPRLGITGALLFNAGWFAQALEGPRGAVERIFERIQQDPRHAEVTLLAFTAAPQRMFPGWAMAFVGAPTPRLAAFAGVARDFGPDPAAMPGEAVLDTLHRLVLQADTRV